MSRLCSCLHEDLHCYPLQQFKVSAVLLLEIPVPAQSQQCDNVMVHFSGYPLYLESQKVDPTVLLAGWEYRLWGQNTMFFHDWIFTCNIIGQDIGLVSGSRSSFVVWVKFTNLIKLVFKRWTSYGVDREKQARMLGTRHRWNVETVWLVTGSYYRIGIGNVGMSLSLLVWVSVFPAEYASWMMSWLWGMPAPKRSRMPLSHCPQPALLPSLPSLKSSKKWWNLSPCSLRWNLIGLRSEYWVCKEMGGVGEQVNNGTLQAIWKKQLGYLLPLPKVGSGKVCPNLYWNL